MLSNKQIFLLIIICALVFTGFGYWVLPKILGQSATVSQRAANLPPGQNTFAAGLNAAYNRLIARGRADVAVPGYGYQESKTIGGKINEIKNNQIILEVYPVNALADPALDQRTIKISGATKIYKQVEKTPEQMKQDNETFRKQMEEFSQQMKEGKDRELPEPPMPPEPFGREEIKLTDLKAGAQITATAKDDIHAAKEFIALEIMAQFTGRAD